jgi:hypothetical protein
MDLFPLTAVTAFPDESVVISDPAQISAPVRTQEQVPNICTSILSPDTPEERATPIILCPEDAALMDACDAIDSAPD